MNRTEVAQLVAVRYQVAHYFCQLLARLAKRLTPYPQLRQIVLANLREKLGQDQAYGGKPHFEGRRKLLAALGVNQELSGTLNRLDSRLHPAARRVLESFRELIDGEPLIAYGAMTEYESLVPSQYQSLVALLRRYWTELANDDMNHLLDHIQHDIQHGQEMFDALDSNQQPAAARGAERAREIWQEFWAAFNIRT